MPSPMKQNNGGNLICLKQNMRESSDRRWEHLDCNEKSNRAHAREVSSQSNKENDSEWRDEYFDERKGQKWFELNEDIEVVLAGTIDENLDDCSYRCDQSKEIMFSSSYNNDESETPDQFEVETNPTVLRYCLESPLTSAVTSQGKYRGRSLEDAMSNMGERDPRSTPQIKESLAIIEATSSIPHLEYAIIQLESEREIIGEKLSERESQLGNVQARLSLLEQELRAEQELRIKSEVREKAAAANAIAEAASEARKSALEQVRTTLAAEANEKIVQSLEGTQQEKTRIALQKKLKAERIVIADLDKSNDRLQRELDQSKSDLHASHVKLFELQAKGDVLKGDIADKSTENERYEIIIQEQHETIIASRVSFNEEKLALQEKLDTLKNIAEEKELICHRLEKLEKEKDYLKEDLAKKENELGVQTDAGKANIERHDRMQGEIENLGVSLEKKDRKLMNTIDNYIAKEDSFKMSLANLDRDLESLRATHDAKEIQLRQLQVELDVERKLRVEAERHCEVSRDEFADLCQRSKTVEDALLENSRTRSLLRGQVEDALDTIEELSNRECRLQAKLDSGNFVINSLGQKIVSLQQELTREEQSRLLVVNRLDKQRSWAVELEQKLEAAQKFINSLSCDISRLESTAENAVTDKAGLEQELNDERKSRIIVVKQFDDQRRRLIDYECKLNHYNECNKKRESAVKFGKVHDTMRSPGNVASHGSPDGYQQKPLNPRQLWTSFVHKFCGVLRGESRTPEICLDDYGENKLSKLFQELSFERSGSPTNKRVVHLQRSDFCKSAQSPFIGHKSDGECFFDALSEEEDLA